MQPMLPQIFRRFFFQCNPASPTAVVIGESGESGESGERLHGTLDEFQLSKVFSLQFHGVQAWDDRVPAW